MAIPWFILADVYRVLGIANPSDAASRLDADEKNALAITEGGKINGLGVVGAMPTIINEYGLYSLTFTSRKPEAKEFKRWITHTVLPSIRKNGGYIAGQEKLVDGEMTEDEFVLKAITIR
jgi:prophage antirepressor-like protein